MPFVARKSVVGQSEPRLINMKSPLEIQKNEMRSES